MNISTLIRQGVLIVRVEGELDMHVVDEFRDKVDNALDDSGVKYLLLSLKGVTFIDSSGVGAILGRYKRISASGGKVLAANVRPQVARVFELSGLLTIIKMCASETEALENL